VYKLAERCFQVAIECVIDIANYLIAQNNWTRPLYHAEALLVLAQHRIFPMKFARRITGMINFRNILVHGYLRIDRAIVYENLKELHDFAEFEKYLLGYLSRHEKTRSKRAVHLKRTKK